MIVEYHESDIVYAIATTESYFSFLDENVHRFTDGAEQLNSCAEVCVWAYEDTSGAAELRDRTNVTALDAPRGSDEHEVITERL